MINFVILCIAAWLNLFGLIEFHENKVFCVIVCAVIEILFTIFYLIQKRKL